MDNKTPDNKQEFKWTDALIREFVNFGFKHEYLSKPLDLDKCINDFKKSKKHKVEEKRTEVISLTYCGSNGKAFGFQDEIYYFVVNQKIPQERYEAVKQPIESALNPPVFSDSIPTLERQYYVPLGEGGKCPEIPLTPPQESKQDSKVEQYILENKPCLSVKEVKDYWDKHYNGHLLIADFPKNITLLAKIKNTTH